MTNWRAMLLGVALGVVVLGASLGSTGCAGTSLPIPPPTGLVSAPDAAGFVTITGHADTRAFVFALNERTEVGAIVHADEMGAFSIRLPAIVGDSVTVWQEINNQPGQQLSLEVRAP